MGSGEKRKKILQIVPAYSNLEIFPSYSLRSVLLLSHALLLSLSLLSLTSYLLLFTFFTVPYLHSLVKFVTFLPFYIITNQTYKGFAVFFQLYFSYSVDSGKLYQSRRFPTAHVIKAGISKNNVSW